MSVSKILETASYLSANARKISKLSFRQQFSSEMPIQIFQNSTNAISTLSFGGDNTVANGGLRRFLNLRDGSFEILDSNQSNTIGGQPISLKYMRNFYGTKNYNGRLFTENYIFLIR